MSKPAADGHPPVAHAVPPHANASSWIPLDPALAGSLSEARQQLHHAAQLAAAAGISYLDPRPDDSHTNLEWFHSLGALVSHEIPSAGRARVGIAVEALAVLIVDGHGGATATLALNGHTLAKAAAWIRERLAELGADPKRFTLDRHYTIPAHPVASGARFDAGASSAMTELTHWFADAAALLGEVATSTNGASPVRCWPHHFDIATLIEVGHHADGTRTIGIGLEPGDDDYDEPYLYVTMNPAPPSKALIMPLAGGGSWHTRDWVGAILPGSRLVAHPSDQEQEVRVFLKSARAACRMLIEGM